MTAVQSEVSGLSDDELQDRYWSAWFDYYSAWRNCVGCFGAKLLRDRGSAIAPLEREMAKRKLPGHNLPEETEDET